MSAAAAAVRRGVTNEGGFFSPYYLFDLMARQHADELDREGRDRERRRLPRAYRRALAHLDRESTLAAVWREWFRELFEALRLETQSAEEPFRTARSGRVPVSHVVVGPQGVVLALLDVHPLGTDLDRDRYAEKRDSAHHLSEEPISRAFEMALDGQEVRWGLLSNGYEIRLYRKGGTISRQFLRVDFDALFDADRDDEWTAFWGLFRREAFVVDPSVGGGKCFLDVVIDESRRHASRIAEDLRGNVVDALEALVQGALDEKDNAGLWGGGRPDDATVRRLFEESLYFLYRVLFVLYAESRDILPVGASRTYGDGYSVEHLRSMAERDLHPDDERKTYYADSLRTLFRLLRRGFRCGEFEIPALGGRGPEDPDWETRRFEGDPRLTSLFDGRRTPLLDRCRIPDRALRRVIAELSLSRPRRKSDRRERYSYADLGIDQLGSVYEGLLVYEPTIVEEEMVVAKVKGEERLVTREQADAGGFPIVPGSEKRPGEFVLRLWGGSRKGSGSYYTPHEITAFLVKEALDPLVEPIIERCAAARRAEQARAAAEAAANPGTLALPRERQGIAEEILDVKICDPAMGSGAFLIQACRQLAEAYGRALVAEGRDETERVEAREMARYERMVAERCLYGVDLNPLAVELAKVSLWLETLAKGRPLSFLDARLRCGNSLLGAPLRDDAGGVTSDFIATLPSEALALVTKGATESRKAVVARAIKENNATLKRWREESQKQRHFEGIEFDGRRIRGLLDAYLENRSAFAESDADRSDSEAHGLREEKERRFQEAYAGLQSAARRLKSICDLWCSAWFWPEEEDAAPILDTAQYRRAVTSLLRGDRVETPWWPVAESVAREQRFFHWELEFPEVFLREAGGFDAVVGNPPWEKVSGDPGELATEFDPMIKLERGTKRDERIAAVLADERFGPGIRASARSRAQYARYCREGRPFAGRVSGEVNTFAPFTVQGFHLVRAGGTLALVLKDGFHLHVDLDGVRAELLTRGRIRILASADNERKVFDAHNQLRFDLLVAERGSTGTHVPFSVHRFRNAQEIVERAVTEAARIPVAMLRGADGRPGEPIPEILDAAWPDLFEKARRAAEGGVPVRWSAELHSSGDKACWTRDGRPDGSPGPVLAMVAAFDALAYEPMAWLVPDALRMDKFRKVLWDRWRVAVRKRADQKNERVIIAAMVPPRVATCDFLQTSKEPSDPISAANLAALANSLLLDYLIRPWVGSNMQAGLLHRLPWRLGSVAEQSELAALVGCLTCARSEFDGLRVALDCPVTLPKDAYSRGLCRARIDARVARLYGLTSREFARVLAWFPLLDQGEPALSGEPKSTLTRDLALLEFLRLSGESAPGDVVTFFAEAGVDVAGRTGSVRALEERVRAATALGAVAYRPSERARESEDDDAAAEESGEPARDSLRPTSGVADNSVDYALASRVLQTLGEAPQSANALVTQLGVEKDALRRVLDHLRAEGLIVSEGRGRASRWRRADGAPSAVADRSEPG